MQGKFRTKVPSFVVFSSFVLFFSFCVFERPTTRVHLARVLACCCCSRRSGVAISSCTDIKYEDTPDGPFSVSVFPTHVSVRPCVSTASVCEPEIILSLLCFFFEALGCFILHLYTIQPTMFFLYVLFGRQSSQTAWPTTSRAHTHIRQKRHLPQRQITKKGVASIHIRIHTHIFEYTIHPHSQTHTGTHHTLIYTYTHTRV